MNCLCRSSKIISVRIVLLDETEFLHELKDDLPGQSLLDTVFSRLNLIETAYFGIRYLDHENQTHWLDPTARLLRQLNATTEPFDLYFGVKFYAADPCKLLEEITRYQIFLQVKQDVLQGRLPVSFELAAELGAYVVQSELGDYESRRHSTGYVSELRLLTNQTRDLELRVSELHQQLKGMSPSTAELNYLDKVKWHDLYGVDLHPVLGEDSVEYFLGLTPSGIVVLRNKTTVAHYYWPRIAKVYFKGRYFMLRVSDKNNEASTYGFETPRKSACKHLWRCCVEHHAFFRLVRVAPTQPPVGAGEFFSLGSRFRYSGRTEKQAVKDAIAQARTPPTFKRTPSKRQPRRMFEDLIESKTADNHSRFLKHEIKTVSIPQPAQSTDSAYRSTNSIPANLNSRQNNNAKSNAPDSPRSTRSAPWARSQQRGLFGLTASPRSVRSASTRDNHISTHRYRSSSVESHSSNESRSGKRHRHKSKRTSDNESELSRGSGRSGRSHNSHRKHRRQRSKHRRNDSGSENDSTRARSYSGHRVSTGSTELIDSGSQWREVQRRQAESYGISSVHQAAVTKSSMVPRHTPNEHENQTYHTRNKKHRKHRSPSEHRPKIWSSELAKHLQFDLVDTAGMTEDQLREISYTVVGTHSSKRLGTNSLKVHKNSVAKDRVDRIRDSIYIKDSGMGHESGPVNGSIRSASTISSSKDGDKNSGLVRIMSSLSMGDFISPSNSSLSPLDGSGLRVSHEHTDSGLGGDQDYAYSSERSSDSTKYETNKSSGASVTSGGHSKSGHLSSSTTQLHSVSNRKPPLHPSRHQKNATATVHNSNNRLMNNTVFENNQYTFSLSRISGNGVGLSPNGYLETRPLSSASIHGEGIQLTRGTKSDIGEPVRRQSSKQITTINGGTHKKKVSCTDSDLISYISTPNHSCTNNSAYFLSNYSSSDYLENYKTERKNMYYIQKKVEEGGNYNKQQLTVNNTLAFNPTVGPLLYLDHLNNHQLSNKYYQTLQNNPSSVEIQLPGAPSMEQCKKIRTSDKLPSRSTSLELILTPIIQSSRRAQ